MPSQFQGPIPGQSLTTQPGGAPWEQPPQFTDLNTYLEMLFDKLTEKRQATRIAVMLKAGLAAEEIARVMTYSAFTSGVINPDLALLALRPTIYIIVAVGYRLGIKKMTIMLPDKDQQDFLAQFNDILEKEKVEASPEPEMPPVPTGDKLQLDGALGSL